MTYFSSFPTVLYSNTVVTDITRRVGVPASVLREPTAFSPYTIEAGQRSDLVSYLYYGQDDDDWLISLANQLVDPYYGWFLNDDELGRFVEGKYGSLPAAMGRIAYWLVNWASDPREATIAYYDALTENLKKYWIPVFGDGSTILSYSRRQEDWTQATNRLMDVNLASAAPFQEGELVTVYDPQGNMQGTGELCMIASDSVVVKDVQGTWSDGFTMTSASGSSVITIGQILPLIPLDEEVYFTPVSCYDVEYDHNEANKEVLLIQGGYRGIMYSELAQTLNK